MLRSPMILLALGVPTVAGAATLNVCASCSYTTIGGAYTDASNGDTLVVAAGTYNERVDFNKHLTVIGAGAGSTVWNDSGGGGAPATTTGGKT
ncbi:MAG: hypothetical protein JXX28_03475, partial [Deltaproteobacteria bacterium]|nr:hypothetical protein [Deltaproteobacteria bacterium]